MALLFEWDGKKAIGNQQKHDVTFEEATTVFLDDDSLTIDDPDHSERELRQITMGRAHTDRLLVVVHTERSGHIRIISARRASKKERAQYDSHATPNDHGPEEEG